jgi:CIC family chloride channel protein
MPQSAEGISPDQQTQAMLSEASLSPPSFQHPVSRERRLFLILPIFIGIISGLLVVCFRISIEWLRLALIGKYMHPGDWRLIAVPGAVGLVVGILVHYAFPAARGSGINQTKAAMYVHDGYISMRTMFGKLICTALALWLRAGP